MLEQRHHNRKTDGFIGFDKKEIDNIIPGVKWKTVINQPHILYACGYKSGSDPLTKDDLALSGSDKVPEGFASVQDVKFPYEAKPLNLAYSYHEKSEGTLWGRC